MQTPTPLRRVLLLSTVHPATDPRIVGKIAATLAEHYEVKILLPEQPPPLAMWYVGMPFFKKLWLRVLVCHPIAFAEFLRFRPHIVHIFVAELLPLAFVFRWLGTEVIYEVQENLYKKIPLKAYNRGWVFERLFRYFDRKARSTFKFIFTEDAYLNEYQPLSHPYAVIHNFASSEWLSLPAPVPDIVNPCFFYAGVISYERAFNTMLKALLLVKKKYPTVCLRLFGPLRIAESELHRSPEYRAVKENLVFYGYKPQAEAFACAKDAVAGIALLKPVGDYADSYPTKLFDYMALGLPVITSDLPLLRDVVEPTQCGFCVSPYEAEALGERMVWMIEHPEELRQMGNNGRKAVREKYGWEKEKLLSLYAMDRSLMR
ncbi:MAG: glycosyltransferase [Spirosomataceae bacterium]